MITREPAPGSVITWRLRFAPYGPEYHYVALRVAGRGWYTTSQKITRPLMWSELAALIGDEAAFVAVGWARADDGQ